LDELTPVVVARRPNVDEAIAAFMPIALQRPAVATYRVLVFAMGLIIVAAGIATLVYGRQYLYGTVWIVVGAFFLTRPFFAMRNAVRRLVVSSAKRLTDTHEVMTISAAGIDAKSDNASSHFDWSALSMARRLPTGLVYQVGGTTYYVSASEFASVAEFDRAIAIVRGGVGSNFRD
jgi:hypothetical protein